MSQLQRLVIAPTQRQNDQIFLTSSQQHYLVRVLRLGKGDRFIALDGQGGWWLSELAANLSEAIIIELLSVQTELPISVTLMAAMPKGNGFEQIISGTTELGVACIIPIKSDRTLLNPSPQKLERWRRLAQEAAEQSERQIVPTILDPVNFTTSLEQAVSLDAYRYICVTRRDAPHFLSCLSENKLFLKTGHVDPFKLPSISIAIGPEGGWSDDEIEQAIAAEFQPVSLGYRILRTITAPIVALSLVGAVLESTAN
ncbi:MAG TPA: 16S rRNA (uracil(1498)-N(3))-methyltransferase [Cyanobacteria bacterium UBA12227]|nr:16S rRNA (uracil(1498)-N(3))-methyltransferase [Cyanobacteria bacterium UBA12227]